MWVELALFQRSSSAIRGDFVISSGSILWRVNRPTEPCQLFPFIQK
jgi:hypothetical protein